MCRGTVRLCSSSQLLFIAWKRLLSESFSFIGTNRKKRNSYSAGSVIATGQGISLLLRCLLGERKHDCEMGGILYKGRNNKQVKINVKIAICCDVMPCGLV